MSLAGHAVSGWRADAEARRQHGEGETVFENWESEFLQMGFYVLLTVFLYQRGSSESKKHDGTDAVEEDPFAHRDDPGVP